MNFLKFNVMKLQAITVFLLIAAVTFSAPLSVIAQDAQPDNPRLTLTKETDDQTGSSISRGSYKVYEDRNAKQGKMISLNLVILHATGSEPKPDPVFVLQGGPGLAAAKNYRGYINSWMRKDRDIVLVSQRGTDGDNKLSVAPPMTKKNVQNYLSPGFDFDSAITMLKKLEEKYDLTKYSTPIAMDDLNEIRQVLGYDKINLTGGSYGTRAELVYMRRHPKTVRTAVLNGIAPISFTNPLYHAQAAQMGIDLIFEEVKSDPGYRKAFPDLESKFYEILKRLEQNPAKITVKVAGTDEEIILTLTRNAFAEAVRVMMYYTSSNRQVPYLLIRAYKGDYKPFVLRSIQSNRGIRDIIAFGMLLCVTAAEDVARIDEEGIVRETKDTFLGDIRVRRQKAICDVWPKSDLPDNWAEPVSVDVPALLLSGTHDPVTPPMWGEKAASHLPNSLHLVVPGAHGVGGSCIGKIIQQFLESGSVEDIDTSCVESMKMPRLKIGE